MELAINSIKTSDELAKAEADFLAANQQYFGAMPNETWDQFATYVRALDHLGNRDLFADLPEGRFATPARPLNTAIQEIAINAALAATSLVDAKKILAEAKDLLV